MQDKQFQIAVIGSSGTKGSGVPEGTSCVSQLEQICRHHNFDVSIRNYSSPGLPIQALAERILFVEKVYTPDMYLIALPTYATIYIGLNGMKNIQESTFSQNKILGLEEETQPGLGRSPTRIFFGNIHKDLPNPKFSLVCNLWFKTIVKPNNPEVSFSSFKDFLLFLAENVVHSELQHVQHGKEIFLLQQLLKNLNKLYVMFDWWNYNSRADRQLGPFGDLIDFTTYVLEGKYSAEEFLKLIARENRKDIWLDDSGHATEKGHTLIAKEFLFPWLKEHFFVHAPIITQN